MGDIIFVGSAKDYHTMDWYRLVKELCAKRNVCIATDLIESEGHDRIVTSQDNIIPLFIVDSLLFKTQTALANYWRNVIKLVVTPFAAINLHALYKKRKGAVFHAHSMFYITLCWVARIKYIATPMGSDVLVRPDHSALYKFFTIRALRGASAITVDSEALKNKIRDLCQVDSTIVQNGIDTAAIARFVAKSASRSRVVSIRALDPNYRIRELVEARNASNLRPRIEFVYPFCEVGYQQTIRNMMLDGDTDHGRITREEMYRIFGETLLAVSIPLSDSSPRTVYEAIFCGCCVAVSYGTWIDELPDCMRARIYIMDFDNKDWLDDAVAFARDLTKRPYVPSQVAIQVYDQKEAMKTVCRTFYDEVI